MAEYIEPNYMSVPSTEFSYRVLIGRREEFGRVLGIIGLLTLTPTAQIPKA